MICDNCGKKGVRVRKTTRVYGRGANLLVIEDVPVCACPHCGETYLTAETLHEIERIRSHKKQLSTKRSTPVAQFA
jgi:YgiT-type zinc finger domain-containing protein